MIIGLGTDVIGIERLAATYERQGQAFLDRVYTPDEQAYCLAFRQPAERLAGRWAAKEAAMKAFGRGLGQGLTMVEIEVVHDPFGVPRLRLHGRARERATVLGVWRSHCSVSHADGYAVATVILEQA